jgi:hypothetical protein
VIVDAQVAAFVAAVFERSAIEVLAVRPYAEGSEPDVGDELVELAAQLVRAAAGRRDR